MSRVLTSPMLADHVNVLRRPQSINGYGEVVIGPVETFQRVVAVVTMASPDDLERLDDNQRMGRNISVVTNFAAQGPAPGFQPDEITWPISNGDTYVVKAVDPYPQFGPGFVQVIAGSIDSIDQPQSEMI